LQSAANGGTHFSSTLADNRRTRKATRPISNSELAVGDRGEITRTLRKEDIELFAVMSDDVNGKPKLPTSQAIAHIEAQPAKSRDPVLRRESASTMQRSAEPARQA
jgi:DUF1009 family protein